MFNTPQFQQLARIIGVVLIALFGLMALNSLGDVLAKWGVASSYDEPRTITISAQGRTTVTPDTARFNASVVTRGIEPKDVSAKNTEAMNAVVNFLKDSGVSADDIKTVNYNLYPQYDYVEGRQIPAGYVLEQTAQVTVRDLTKTGELVSGAVEKGANQVSSIQFFVDDPDEFKALARAEAFGEAREKARAMAKEAGVRLGGVISFSESSGDVPPPIYYERAAFGIGGGGAAPLEPGSQELTVIITVTYEIH